MKEKPIDKVYWSITEVATVLSVAPSLIRYWMDELNIRSNRTKKGNRLFNVESFTEICNAYYIIKVEGHTLEGARRILTKTPIPTKQQFLEKKLNKLKSNDYQPRRKSSPKQGGPSETTGLSQGHGTQNADRVDTRGDDNFGPGHSEQRETPGPGYFY